MIKFCLSERFFLKIFVVSHYIFFKDRDRAYLRSIKDHGTFPRSDRDLLAIDASLSTDHADGQVRMKAIIFTSHRVKTLKTWCVLTLVITCLICATSNSVLYIIYSCMCRTEPTVMAAWCRCGGHMQHQCAILFFSMLSIVLNPSAGAITDHSQSAIDTFPYFKSKLYVEHSVTESLYSFYRMG